MRQLLIIYLFLCALFCDIAYRFRKYQPTTIEDRNFLIREALDGTRNAHKE